MYSITHTKTVGKKKVHHRMELFSSAKEMPIKRHKAMVLMLVQEAGLGGMDSLDKRLMNTMMLMEAGKAYEASTELQNFRFAFFSLLLGLDYKTKAFACLVANINGKEYNDITDDGLKKVQAEIEDIGFSGDQLDEHFGVVKKKLISS